MTAHSSFVDIALTSRNAGRNRSVYSYRTKEDVHVGDLVRVPFGRVSAYGIVIHTSQSAPEKRVYKSVSNIIRRGAVSPGQIELAQTLAHEYLAPLGIVVRRAIFPEPPKRETKPETTKKTKSLPKRIPAIAKRLAGVKKHTLFLAPQGDTRTETLLLAARERVRTGGQALLLFPDRGALEKAHELAQAVLPENAAILLHGSLSSGRKHRAWERIANPKKSSIVLAVASGVFAPFSRLRAVFLDDAYRSSHKQSYAAPRYDSRRAALLLAEIHGCLVVFSDKHAHVSLLRDRKDGKWNFIDAKNPSRKTPRLRITNAWPPSFEERKKQKSGDVFFSQELLDTIRWTLGRKQRFFLLASRRGASGLSVCAGCKRVLLCPECDRALVAQSDEGYRCLHCKHVSDMFTACPSCGSMRFLRRIPGTQAMEKKVRSLFPKSNVLRIDADTEFFASRAKTGYREKLEKADIIVATPALANFWPIEAPGGIGVLDADAFWRWPDFEAEEQAFHLFSRLLNITSPEGFVTIQSRRPDHRVLEALASPQAAEDFLETLLEERQGLRYPPFSRLLVLTGRNRDEKTLLTQSKHLTERAREILGASARISSPFAPMREKKKGFAFRRIVIKLLQDSSKPLPQEAAVFTDKLPTNWRADIDPKEVV